MFVSMEKEVTGNGEQGTETGVFRAENGGSFVCMRCVLGY